MLEVYKDYAFGERAGVRIRVHSTVKSHASLIVLFSCPVGQLFTLKYYDMDAAQGRCPFGSSPFGEIPNGQLSHILLSYLMV